MEFNLADLFEGVVDSVTQIDPDRLALVAGDVRLTYSELDARANRLAHYLIDAGVGPGDHVGIYSWNRAEWIESMLGVYKIRAVPININYRYVVDELAYIFDNADLVALVFERAFSPNVTATDLPSSLSRLIVIDDGSPEALPPGAVTYEEALEAFAPDRRGLGPRSPDDLYILYTGGTTGMPKGVMWRSEDIFFAALGGGNAAFPIAQAQDIAKNASGRGGTFVVTPPMMHGAAQWVALIALFSAGTVALYVGHTFDPEAVLDLAQSERAISILVVGDAMARPLAETIGAHPGRWDLSALLVIGSGGAILSEAIKNQLQNELPGVRILDSFGASETGHNGSVHDIDVTTGRPRFRVGPHTAVLGDDLLPVTPGSGQIGRLARRGNIPLAYYKDADKTAATFLIDPDGQRWVIPGDHASVDGDGHVLVLGRGSECINTGGEKVFPEEVEAALKSHPDVYDAVVVGIPDERFTERVAALVQARPGGSPDLAGLSEHCRRRIAGFKAPRELVLVNDLHRSAAGKPDYRWARQVALAALGLEPLADDAKPSQAGKPPKLPRPD